MNKIFKTSLIIGIFLQLLSAVASEMPPVTTTPQQDEAIWKEYCGSVPRNSSETPIPNYSSPKIKSIVKTLAMVSPFSYYFYSGPMYAYGLKNGKEQVNVPANFPDVPEIHNGRKNAHAFLTILCGEFRDRPSLIEAKINWVRRFYTLPLTVQKPINVKLDLWPQVSANSYKAYISNSRAIFSAKEHFLKQSNQTAIITNTGGKKPKYNEDFPVEPFTVCETKFIFKRYVETNGTFGGAGDLSLHGRNEAMSDRRIASEADQAKEIAACIEGGGTQEFCSAKPDAAIASMPIMPPGPDIHGPEDADEEEWDKEEEEFHDVKETSQKRAQPLQVYLKQYGKFKKQCPKADLEHFYDFRGDSNFKPNSPESNGMIWYSSSITSACVRKDGKFILKDKAKERFQDQDICEKYFQAPFKYRWSAARAGLATWMMHDQKFDTTFAQSDDNVTIYPHLEPMAKPFGFRMLQQEEPLHPYYSSLDKNAQGQVVGWDDEAAKEKVLEGKELADALAAEEENLAEYAKYKADWEAKHAAKPNDGVLFQFIPKFADNQTEFWKRADLGFNDVVGFHKTAKVANRELAYERIRNAVNRHTDWYSSAYDDGSGTTRDQAYSPFVASSYEMSASDGFTAPGVTVNSPADGCKHWMFVFKLKKDQWYNTRSIIGKVPFDFNRHWFDETSLGTNGLADSERALDRLGTALEGEMDSILYLHNITRSGKVDGKCGNDAIVKTFLTPAVVVAPTPAVSPAVLPSAQ